MTHTSDTRARGPTTTNNYETNISILVHGEAGAGKSWFGQTTPGPRLVLDAEGGTRHAKRRGAKVNKVTWDPTKDDPPTNDGTWDTCVVFVRDYKVLKSVYEWLNTSAHPFRSVVFDSLTEIQQRCKDAIRGDEKMTENMWGTLLDEMSILIRQFRDLTFHPTHPLDAIVIIALTKAGAVGIKSKPYVQGSLAVNLPGYVDVVGFLRQVTDENGDAQRYMLIGPHDLYEAKDRTDTLTQFYGKVIQEPDVEHMLAVLNDQWPDGALDTEE